MQKKMIIFKQLPGNRLKNSHLNLTKTKKSFNAELKHEKDKKKISKINKKIKLLEKIEKLNDTINNLQSEIHKASTKEHKIKSVFITFHNIKHRNLFLKLMPKTFAHFYQKFSNEKQQKLMEEDKLVYAEVPPLPSNIKWKNYNYTSCQKFIRRLGVWSVYVLMFGIRKKKFFLTKFLNLFLNFF